MKLKIIRKFKKPIGLIVKSIKQLDKQYYKCAQGDYYISKKDFGIQRLDENGCTTKNLYLLSVEAETTYKIISKEKTGFNCVFINFNNTKINDEDIAIIPYWAIDKLLGEDDVEYFI